MLHGGASERDVYSIADVTRCMDRVTTVGLGQEIQVDSELSLRPFYAGHVLGMRVFYSPALSVLSSSMDTYHYESI